MQGGGRRASHPAGKTYYQYRVKEMFIDESMPLWIRGLVKGVSFMPRQSHPNKQLDEGTP